LKAETKKLKKDLISSRTQKDKNPSSLNNASQAADSGQSCWFDCECGTLLIQAYNFMWLLKAERYWVCQYL